MSTVYSSGVWRTEVTATKPDGEAQVSPIVMIPEGVIDLTLYAVASAAVSGKIEESPSSPDAILTATGDTWMPVDDNLSSFGSTLTRVVLMGRAPVALRVTSLTTDETATMILTGRRVGR